MNFQGLMGCGHSFHIYEMLWRFPKEYGGMTRAMLSRCAQFSQFNIGESLTILTLEPGLIPLEVEQKILTPRGIPASVRVRNIWHDLRQADDAQLHRLAGNAPYGFEQDIRYTDYTEPGCYVREYQDIAGGLTRREHIREDGGLAVSDERAKNKRRRIVLYDSCGTPIKYWQRATDLYLAWIDWVIIQRPAVLINESKKIGEFVFRAQMHNVGVCQVIHGRHIKTRHSSFAPYGDLLPSRSKLVKNLESFDMVAVLTELQKEDLFALGADVSNMTVLPNSLDLKPTIRPQVCTDARRPDRGVVVAKLEPLKRVAHAIRAISDLGKNHGLTEVSLSIFGNGKKRSALVRLRDQLNLGEQVEFKGYVSDVASCLSEYSFLLLTSVSEGFSLVLLEAMAKGCIPIAYDVRYGPPYIITHGVDGYLVPGYDERAIATTIKHFLDLPDKHRAEMRCAAMQRAHCFSPEVQMRLWSNALATMMETARSDQSGYEECSAHAECIENNGDHCRIRGTIRGSERDMRRAAKLVVAPRDGNSFIKVVPTFEKVEDKKFTFVAEFLFSCFPQTQNAVLDFYMQPVGTPWTNKIRICDVAADDRPVFATAEIQNKAWESQH
jgi:poly(glycerol-phosphate) alpha-glucosyltransferase